MSETEGHGAEQDKPRRKRRRRSDGNSARSAGDVRRGEEARSVTSEDRPKKRRRRRRRKDEHEERDPTQQVPEPKAIADRDWDPSIFHVDKTFADLGLRSSLVKGCEAAGYKHPTSIQAELVPLALTGRDILGQAKTGTGKTAAFALPLLHQAEKGLAFQTIILAPTRELAIQIQQDFAQLGRFTPIRCVAIYGGQSISTQARKLEEGPEIIVGTPGRVLDMIDRKHLHLRNVRFAVLDEVDRMFDIGFRDDIRQILKKCPTDRQTIFVSATMSGEIEDLARRHMRDPEKLVVSAGSLTVDMVDQYYLSVQPWDKRRLLAHLLTHEEPALTLVFCRMKRTVDSVVQYLGRKGIEAHAIHGDMTQSQRNRTMEKLRKGKLEVLVASDLASRGIDVEGITHVVNYDLPEDPDIYVHRIGRTARAGRDGVAWSLVTPAQGALLTQIELLINAEIPKLDYPDFEERPRPEDWKDEAPSPHYVVQTDKQAEPSRFERQTVPAATKLSEEQLKAKFPGGVVPSKLPPRQMRGRVRPRGR
ncbi:MAG: DEAD/DEAH box helicase [Planctomycetota bacterium]|nr:MAG: DEAD/DEAH box helicase [Planctomycetota bacterium]